MKLGKKLGSGAHSVVYSVVIQGARRALKIVTIYIFIVSSTRLGSYSKKRIDCCAGCGLCLSEVSQKLRTLSY